MNESREIPLVNSAKAATCDACCYPYLNQFEWHLLADDRAARTEPCEDNPEHPHLMLMEQEVVDRHRCEIEHLSGMWDNEGTGCYECPAGVGEVHSAGFRSRSAS